MYALKNYQIAITVNMTINVKLVDAILIMRWRTFVMSVSPKSDTIMHLTGLKKLATVIN